MVMVIGVRQTASALLAATIVIASVLSGCTSVSVPDAEVVTAEPSYEPSKSAPPAPVLPSGAPAGVYNPSYPGDAGEVDAGSPVSNIPRIDKLLPANLPTGTAVHLPDLIAVPIKTLTPGYANPHDLAPTIWLSSATDTRIEPLAARWTVVDTMGDWIQVLVPVGRRALPSQDKSLVNHAAAWVHQSEVQLVPSDWRIEVNTGARTLTVKRNNIAQATFPVGVGVPNTPTPKGLCSWIGHVRTMNGGPQILTSCQSETLNSWMGYPWAATAIHQSLNGGRDIGIAVSNGCVRVRSADYAKYLDGIPVGTPIIIT